MKTEDWKKALLFEARQLGHAEARTIIREKAAQQLVQEGKLILGGTIGGVTLKNGERARWYKVAS